MKEFVREVKPHAKLYRDSETGIAWIADGRAGLAVSVHASIDATGSVQGMRRTGQWGKDDRVVRSYGDVYNIDSFICDPNNELEMIVANECMCAGCRERRSIELPLDEKILDAQERSNEGTGKNGIDLSEYEYVGNVDGYSTFRKIVRDDEGNMRGIWAAQHQDGGEAFAITYEQARGFEPIDQSSIKRLARELGEMLLP